MDSLPSVLQLQLVELEHRLLLHDLRGALGTALGWVELSTLDGKPTPEGLSEALEAMRALLMSEHPTSNRQEQATLCDLAALVRESTGLPCESSASPVLCQEEPLRSCLSLVRPTDVLVEEKRPLDGADRMVFLRLRGLDPGGVEGACRPTRERILEASSASRRAAATICLRPLVWWNGGSISSSSTGELLLGFPGGGNNR
jgi:hypothetical protein